MTIGLDKPLYILPFDHRGPFQTKLFGWKRARVGLGDLQRPRRGGCSYQAAGRRHQLGVQRIAEAENPEQDTSCNSE